MPIVPNIPQATHELPGVCGDYLAENDIVILSHHGALAIGHSMMMAWMLTEHLETCFEVAFYAKCLDDKSQLTENQVNLLRDINRRNRTNTR